MTVNKAEVIYTLACMYNDLIYINRLREELNWDLNNKLYDLNKISSCVSYLGDSLDKIRNMDEDIYYNQLLRLYEMKDEIDKIEKQRYEMDYAYNQILQQIMETELLHYVGILLERLEKAVPNEILKYPNSIFDSKYDLSEIYNDIIDRATSLDEQKQDLERVL